MTPAASVDTAALVDNLRHALGSRSYDLLRQVAAAADAQDLADALQ